MGGGRGPGGEEGGPGWVGQRAPVSVCAAPGEAVPGSGTFLGRAVGACFSTGSVQVSDALHDASLHGCQGPC